MNYITTHFIVFCCDRVMTDMEQEIRDLLKEWKEAPEGSKQEAVAKAEYDRLSALQVKTGKLS